MKNDEAIILEKYDIEIKKDEVINMGKDDILILTVGSPDNPPKEREVTAVADSVRDWKNKYNMDFNFVVVDGVVTVFKGDKNE